MVLRFADRRRCAVFLHGHVVALKAVEGPEGFPFEDESVEFIDFGFEGGVYLGPFVRALLLIDVLSVGRMCTRV